MANMLINVVNFIISALGLLLSTIIGALPGTPFGAISNSGVASFLGGFAWIVPFGSMIAITQAWVTCIIAYYGYVVIMRWVKVVA
jgi:uncharacterized MnhB-related membrane protein